VNAKVVQRTLLSLGLVIAGCAKSIKEEAKPLVREPVRTPERATAPQKPYPLVETEVEVSYEGMVPEVLFVQRVDEEAGFYNSGNPRVSPSENYIAFELSFENFNKIIVYRMNWDGLQETGKIGFENPKEISLESPKTMANVEEMLQFSAPESYNYEFTWFPKGSSFIFTSNAGLGEYNLFLGSIDRDDKARAAILKAFKPKIFGDYLMMTDGLKKDGQAKVSPEGGRIVFTSGRTGNGDLYLLDLASGSLEQLTSGEDTDLFPQWSPDGKDIVYTSGGKQAHDIRIVRDAGDERQRDILLVRWFFDDVLPNFSPDGRYISFYTTYNEERDPFNAKRWGLMVIPSDGSSPSAGKELIDYFLVPDVVKDNNQGTAWFPDSRHILFAKNIDSDYNPIYIYDVETRTEALIPTGTDINHEITVSPHGLISFRAQVSGWDRVFVAHTTYFQKYLDEQKFGGTE
jgi:Tol biopolymer transport system component